MALIRGPLMSLEATGKLAELLLYQTWKGRAYVRRLKTAPGVVQPLQRGVRHTVSICSRQWRHLSDLHRQSWAAWAPATRTTDFNKFVGQSIERARTQIGETGGSKTRNLLPHIQPEGAPVGSTHDVVTPVLSPTAEGSLVTIPPTMLDWGNYWAWGVWRATKPNPPSIISGKNVPLMTSNLIGYARVPEYSFNDRETVAGMSYYYAVWLVAPNGEVAAFDR